MKKNSLIAFVVTVLIAFASFACDCGEKKCEGKTCPSTEKKCTDCEKHSQVNPTFESLKKLSGNWEGKIKMGEQVQDAKASYEVTSGGTAVVEKIFVGSPHEMVSIYYPEGRTVKMTHYCMEGNRPVMTLKDSSDKKLSFEMKGHEGISSKKENHMHALDLTMNSDNQITQDWVSFDKGKKSEAVSFVWNRVEDKKAVTAPAKTNGSKSTK